MDQVHTLAPGPAAASAPVAASASASPVAWRAPVRRVSPVPPAAEGRVRRRPPGSPELAVGAGEALRLAYHAAFHGRPADGVAALRDVDTHPGADRPGARWLLGVCLGAQGRYRRAADVLAPPGVEPGSLAASTRASHLRQLGRHAEAEPLDTLAAALAPAAAGPDAALADALVGLVADAVGRADPAAAASRLAAAGEHVAGLDPTEHWRAHLRLDWVGAEYAMLVGDPAVAHARAVRALRRSRAAAAPRHRAKSLLVVGVASHLLGRADAARTLAAAAERAGRLGIPTLVWPARLVLAQVLVTTDPNASRLVRAQAEAVLRAVTDQADASG